MVTNNSANYATGASGTVLTGNGVGVTPTFQTPTGGVTGPGSSTDRAIATWNGTGGTALFNNSTAKIDSSGRFTNTTQPAFFAYQPSTASNATGDGTVYTLGSTVDLTEVYDQGSNFDPATGTFTAPVTGIYQFCMTVDMNGIAAHTLANINITVAGTSAANYYGPLFAPASLGATILASFSTYAKMTASDTCTFTATVSGSTKTVDISGQSLGSGAITYVSGALIC